MSVIEKSTDVDAAKYAVAEQRTANKILAVLHKKYPGYSWRVEFSEDGSSTLAILCTSLTGSNGYRLHTKNMSGSTYLNRCVMAGGEILERYGQRRGRAASADLASAHRDNKGNMIHV